MLVWLDIIVAGIASLHPVSISGSGDPGWLCELVGTVKWKHEEHRDESEAVCAEDKDADVDVICELLTPLFMVSGSSTL